jgi:hypothetical protein
MTFLAQINLCDIARYDLEHILPPHGFLYFFCQSQGLGQAPDTRVWGYIDPYEAGSWKVLYFNGHKTNLAPTSAPPDLPPVARLPECELHAFRPAPCLPPNIDDALIKTLKLDRNEIRQYGEILSAFETTFGGAGDNIYHHHTLLGHGFNMSDDAQLLCQIASKHILPEQWSALDEKARAALVSTAQEWIHLLNIDTDDYVGISWGEYGALAYWIKRANLSMLNFDECLAIEDSL